MRRANAVENTGILTRRDDGAFLGSCFIFRYPEFVLTAAHVVEGVSAKESVVSLPCSRAASEQFAVREIHTHPTADLAVVRIDPPDEMDITWAISQLFDDRTYGIDIVAYGYPAHSASGVIVPTPRLFKGHVQRYFNHVSHLGYEYVAAELNFGCPVGLSGSHIINARHHGRLYGVVTENVSASTEMDSILEVDDAGKEYRESFHNIINYGLALWLPAYADWVDSHVPPVPHEEINRRSKNQERLRAEGKD